MEIPDIYTQQSDAEANVSIAINRVVPPNASIELQMKFDTTLLPNKEKIYTSHFIFGLFILILTAYLFIVGWWEKHLLRRPILPPIRYPRKILALAHQMGTQLTSTKWHQLIDFGKKNAWPLTKLLNEQERQQKTPFWTKFKTNMFTFLSLMIEPIIGTFILLILTLITIDLIQEQINNFSLFCVILFSIIELLILYFAVIKPTRRSYWQKKLNQLSQPPILTGLTSMQVRQIYPLFILSQKNEDWRKKLIKTNPKLAQETHRYKEEK